MTTRREFLSDTRHRIRFIYLPKHSSWLNQIEIFFGILQRKCLRGGNFTSVFELESQLRQFIIYYNTTMAHPFNWTYSGKPLQKNRRPHFVPPHRRIKMREQHKNEVHLSAAPLIATRPQERRRRAHPDPLASRSAGPAWAARSRH
jgi:hypothetical protein